MLLDKLRFLSDAALTRLRNEVKHNVARYVSGDFHDSARENGWAIESVGAQVDLAALTGLRAGRRAQESDIENSIVLYGALAGMTPALAREERVWTRLTHVECLEYSRARWLEGLKGDALEKSIISHMFASGRTGIRDDNALSRLWWNMHIASIADPADPQGALRLIVKSADIRMQFVERPGTAARPPLARGILRAMRRIPDITSSESAFRRFMIAVNKEGGGVLFEALQERDVDGMMDRCADAARLGRGD